MKVLKDNEVAGHIPKDHSKQCKLGMLCGVTVECAVFGKRENKRGNGMETPCIYIVKGPTYMLANTECMIKDYLRRTNFYSTYYILKNFF